MHERVDVCEHRGSFLRSRVLCLCVMLCGMWSSAVSIDMIGVDYLFAGGRKTGNHVFDFLPTLARDYFPATDNQKFVNTAIESPDYALSNAVSTTF